MSVGCGAGGLGGGARQRTEPGPRQNCGGYADRQLLSRTKERGKPRDLLT